MVYFKFLAHFPVDHLADPVVSLETSPADLRRLAVTQTQVTNHQLTLMWKTIIHIYYYYSLIRAFHINVSRWFFTGVWVTTSNLKSTGLFLVFWPFSNMLSFIYIYIYIYILSCFFNYPHIDRQIDRCAAMICMCVGFIMVILFNFGYLFLRRNKSFASICFLS